MERTSEAASRATDKPDNRLARLTVGRPWRELILNDRVLGNIGVSEIFGRSVQINGLG